ncbi:MAG TPA: c-type cytochrome, partial [Candidatus Sulfopaludibacter sp.]|nr:c-type cytochrome [Candidatus Sulfopaludibacter sp.]
HALAACKNCSDDEKRFAFAPVVLNANPARARRRGDSARLVPSNDLVRGQQVYALYCMTCHGARGDGATLGAAGLHPRPVNLTEQEYTLGRLSFSLWNGVAGTAMPAWRELGVDDLSAVAQVVRNFHQAQSEPSIPAPVLALGERVYAARCAQCHGDKGDGNGSAAGQFPIAPTNFQAERPSIAASLRAVRNGIEGTPMAPWTNELSEAELSAVAYFVRGFWTGGPNQ